MVGGSPANRLGVRGGEEGVVFFTSSSVEGGVDETHTSGFALEEQAVAHCSFSVNSSPLSDFVNFCSLCSLSVTLWPY